MITISSCGLPFAALAGPFGVIPGASLSTLKVVQKLDEQTYLVEVPMPNSTFEGYVATATTQDGICKITAIGKDYQADSYGMTVKSKFADMRQMLREKYGNDKMYDQLNYGSIWNEPKDWSMAVMKHERSLASFWDSEKKSNLPENVHAIMLTVNAIGSDTTFLKLTYEFSNIGKCVARKAAVDSRSLYLMIF